MMTLLAPFAAHPQESRGRLYDEAACLTRTPYQRDRDRIVHSAAFRRLIYKTQVFVYHEGDHYRTRLTHSLEVAQIARSFARCLALNEDLVEAIALAHDLGHTPFGHAGEDALHAAMQDVGGFDHNAQSLAIVTFLEGRYGAFRGLNLSWETLEGIVKHNGPLTDQDGKPIGRYQKTGLPHAIRAYATMQDLRLDTQPSLEAQVAALADDIAYNNHDIDDGFRAGCLNVAMLEEVPIAAHALKEVRTKHGLHLPESTLVYEMNRRMITAMVQDVLNETNARIAEANPDTIDDVRALHGPLAQFSQSMAGDIAKLRKFLFAHVYKNPSTSKKMEAAQQIVAELYHHFAQHPEEISKDFQLHVAPYDTISEKRIAGDFVAGMTDRFALQTYARLFGRTSQTLALYDAIADFS